MEVRRPTATGTIARDSLVRHPLTRRAFLAGSAGAGAAAFLAGRPVLGQDAPPPSFDTSTPLKVLLANHTGFYAMVTPEWEQRTGVKVEFTREAFGPMPARLTPAFESGGESWDVVYLWRAWVELYEQYLTPLSELGATPDDSDMLAPAIEASVANSGEWYGYPSNIYTYILYCNKKMFADAGVAIPTTYAEFVSAAERFTGNGTYGYVDGWAPLYLFPKWCVWYHLNDGELYGPNGEVRFDDPVAIKATQDMKDLLPYMPRESIESPWGIYDVEAKKVFLAGQAAMMIDYQHIWYEARDPNVSLLGDDPVEVVVIPGHGGDLPASGTQFVGECFGIPKTSPRKAAALDLIQHYSNAATQLGLLTRRPEIHAFEAADESGFPAYGAPYVDPSIPATDQIVVDVTFQQQQYRGHRYGTRLGYQRISDIAEAAISASLHGADPAEEHAKAQAEIDAYLQANPGA
ncbi:MAG: extracellular solute-binding protein [Chloroflexi bacterium]|nr:extracellular solute-binding protein [Chloroflexota bacterium]